MLTEHSIVPDIKTDVLKTISIFYKNPIIIVITADIY